MLRIPRCRYLFGSMASKRHHLSFRAKFTEFSGIMHKCIASAPQTSTTNRLLRLRFKRRVITISLSGPLVYRSYRYLNPSPKHRFRAMYIYVQSDVVTLKRAFPPKPRKRKPKKKRQGEECYKCIGARERILDQPLLRSSAPTRPVRGRKRSAGWFGQKRGV